LGFSLKKTAWPLIVVVYCTRCRPRIPPAQLCAGIHRASTSFNPNTLPASDAGTLSSADSRHKGKIGTTAEGIQTSEAKLENAVGALIREVMLDGLSLKVYATGSSAFPSSTTRCKSLRSLAGVTYQREEIVRT
jgi:hypothetical protein